MSAESENATNDAEFTSAEAEDDAGSTEGGDVGVMMCETCYNNASQIEVGGDDAEEIKCDVCDLRSRLAEYEQQVADRDARIAELEAQIASPQTEAAKEEAKAAAAAAESDTRPHLMVISDAMFSKMRRNPHTMFLQLGRVPRSFWRKNMDDVGGMSDQVIAGLNGDNVENRTFHVLWCGGLSDTALENYERAKYVTKLQELLEKVCEHEKCTSVTWATLPETTFNAEAREINERMAAWVENKTDIRLLDLRYISRREGTMETNEAMWTPKGGQLVGESLKKFVVEKLELTEAELKAMETSAQEMQALRDKRAKKRVQQDEQALRKQQKLARLALLKAGHPIPGAGPRPFMRRNGPPAAKAAGPFIKGGPPPKRFMPSGANGHNKFGGGSPGTAGFKGKFLKSYPGRAAPDYGASAPAYDRLPAASSRGEPEYLEDPRWRNAKRARPSDTVYDQYDRFASTNRVDHRGGGGGYGEPSLYSRRDDPYRRSPPRAHPGDLGPSMMAGQGSSAPYNRAYGPTGLVGDIRRPQWETYERVGRH